MIRKNQNIGKNKIEKGIHSFIFKFVINFRLWFTFLVCFTWYPSISFLPMFSTCLVGIYFLLFSFICCNCCCCSCCLYRIMRRIFVVIFIFIFFCFCFLEIEKGSLTCTRSLDGFQIIQLQFCIHASMQLNI